MKIHVLHGWHSNIEGGKPAYPKDADHEVRIEFRLANPNPLSGRWTH